MIMLIVRLIVGLSGQTAKGRYLAERSSNVQAEVACKTKSFYPRGTVRDGHDMGTGCKMLGLNDDSYSNLANPRCQSISNTRSNSQYLRHVHPSHQCLKQSLLSPVNHHQKPRKPSIVHSPNFFNTFLPRMLSSSSRSRIGSTMPPLTHACTAGCSYSRSIYSPAAPGS